MPIISPPTESAIALRLEHVSKQYTMYSSYKQLALDSLGIYKLGIKKRPNFPIKRALNDVSLSIRQGERVAIVGRNGAGKSTLLKLLTGNYAPTSGIVTIHGSVQALIHVGLGFHPDMTGHDNIKSALLYSGLAGDAYDAAYDDVVDFCELGDFLYQPFSLYSLGMQARTQFAVSTAIRPDILIIDEVMGAGDGYFAHKSNKRMQTLTKQQGCTLLLVSHDTQQVLQFCERAVRLQDGEIVDDGDATVVVRRYETDIIECLNSMGEAETPSAEKNTETHRDAADGEGGIPVPSVDQVNSFAYRLYLRNDAPFSGAENVDFSVPFNGTRWNVPGVARVTDFRISNESRSEKAQHGDTVCCLVRVAADRPMDIVLELRVTSLASLIPICSISPVIQLSAREEKMLVCKFQLVFGSGDFVVSTRLRRAEDNNIEDALSGLAFFSLTRANHSDPPVLFHPGSWGIDNGVPGEACRISPYV